MPSKFSIAGHPLHPSLVVVPIGLFIWAFVSDLFYLAQDRDSVWYSIAYYTSIAAIVTAAVAALPGIGDFFTIASKNDARTLAVGHMALNLIVLALFTVAAVYMYDDGAREGGELAFVVALHGVGVLLLAVSGWLGGEMVYKHHLAVVPHDEEHIRAEEVAHLPIPERKNAERRAAARERRQRPR